MRHARIKLSLYLNFLVCTILLNSVGIVILQVINHFQVTEVSASILEACKDLSIACASFVSAAYLPRWGYKKAMLSGLVLIFIACVCMPLFNSFLMTKLLFITTGISFALIKLSVYSSISLITDSQDKHASLLSSLEGVFQGGILVGYWLFSYFSTTNNWLNTYWVLAAICGVAFLLLLNAPLNDDQVQLLPKTTPVADFIGMLSLVKLPLVKLFVFSIFIYVFIEQGIQSWLPTFNNKVLCATPNLSIQLSSLFALSIAVGRIGGGWLMHSLNWARVLMLGILVSVVLISLTWPLSQEVVPGVVSSWRQLPLVAYIFPLLGLCLAPVYPTLCSSVLNKLPQAKQSGMSGLIIIFSALGGTIGSRIVSILFENLGGQLAFYVTLIPLALLLIILFPYQKLHTQFKEHD